MVNISWENLNNLKDSEITYLLYMEGRDINAISRIRNLDKNDIEKHIIECKIKYRAFEGAGSTEEVVQKLIRYSRDERLSVLDRMTEKEKKDVEAFALSRLFDSSREECSFYIWLLGECKNRDAVQALVTFLKCSDGNIKRVCCSALGKIGDLKAEEALLLSLNDQRPQVKQYAIKALGKIKSLKALEMLRQLSAGRGEKDYVVRAAKEAILQIEGAGD